METVIKRLSKVGNSRGIIFSANIIQEYGFEPQVIVEKREDGILIKPYKSDFQNKLQALRKNKEKIYKLMEKQAGSKAMQAYYTNPDNVIADIDNDIID